MYNEYIYLYTKQHGDIMKLNRQQLRRIILSETRLITESASSAAVAAAIAASGAGMDKVSGGGALIVALVLGKTLDIASKALYDGLDESIRIALDGLVAAIKSVPENMKNSLIELVVELINDATASIS